MDVEASGWAYVGETSQARYYQVEPKVLAAVALGGSFASSPEDLAYQEAWGQAQSSPAVVIVFFDGSDGQEAGVRRLDATAQASGWLAGTALVGGSLFERAVASFFAGLTPSHVPVQMFGNLPEALRWARIRVAARSARPQGGQDIRV